MTPKSNLHAQSYIGAGYDVLPCHLLSCIYSFSQGLPMAYEPVKYEASTFIDSISEFFGW